jgi:large conductance mechanosensitive channel
VFKEFKTFAMRGNVVDLAVGVIIGAAFGTIVTSLVNDIIMPPIGLATGGIDFRNLFVTLRGDTYPSLEEARKGGAVVIAYGAFLNTVVNFLIVAFAIFLLVKQVNRLQGPAPVEAINTKDCPYCASPIPLKAIRCPHCTSEIAASAAMR